MQRGKAVRILINLFVIAAATISMIPFVLMFFMATQDNGPSVCDRRCILLCIQFCCCMGNGMA